MIVGDVNNPSKTRTLEEFVKVGVADDITYEKFSFMAKCIEEAQIKYPQDNIIYDYMDELEASCHDVILSDNNLVKYKYKPKLLAFDLYKSTEMYFVILALNGMCNIKDFNKKRLKLVEYSDLMTLLNQIYNAEEDSLKYNRRWIEEPDVTINYKTQII